MKITITDKKKPEVILPRKVLDSFLTLVDKYYAVKLTDKDVMRLIKKEPRIAMYMIDGSYQDTHERELIGSYLAEYITNDKFMFWPSNGDSNRDRNKFYRAFIKGCKSKKIAQRLSNV